MDRAHLSIRHLNAGLHRAFPHRRPGAIATAVALLAAGLMAQSDPAFARAKSAAMVMDANSGEVLYARNGDATRYPASLTKMMTLYMVFDEIKAGRLSLDTKITMTDDAAKRPPSKLGLKPGQSILLKDAIRSLITKSANDIAAAIGDHIAGSEAAFARRMTERARALGMTGTTFKNASGLTHSDQVTTARDMITLALHLQDNHPKFYSWFSLKSFHYGGKTYRNHNTLLRSMRGVDGIKTGYTRASGFNLVSSMRHDGKHIIAAVFGGKTARARNAKMRSLLYRTIKKASKRKTRKPAPLLIARPAPVPRKSKQQATRQASAADAGPGPRPFRPADAAAAAPAQPKIAMARVRTVSVLPIEQVARSDLARIAAQPPESKAIGQKHIVRGRAPSTLNQQAASLGQTRNFAAGLARSQTRWALNGPQAEARETRQRPQQENRWQPTNSGSYQIQVGAFPNANDAERQTSSVRARMASLLQAYRAVTMPVTVRGQQMWRARFSGFASADATRTCHELRRNNIDCFVAGP